jgi:hypothetical protein
MGGKHSMALSAGTMEEVCVVWSGF